MTKTKTGTEADWREKAVLSDVNPVIKKRIKCLKLHFRPYPTLYITLGCFTVIF